MLAINKILIVEDELITATSIQELLTEENYEIVGVAQTASDAIALCEKASQFPGVVICDINLKGEIKGIELAKELKKRCCCEILFLTAYSDNKTLADAFQLEPVMYLVKPYRDNQLLIAVQMAFHKLLHKQNTAHNGSLHLTEREKEIAELIAGGHSSKQVARKLLISIETVKTHRRRMLQKNNINSFPHLVYLMNHGKH